MLNPIDLAHAEAAPAPAAGPSLFAVLWRRKALVLLGLTVGSLAGLFYYLRQPAKYQSSAQLYVMKRRAEPLPTANGAVDSRVAFVEDYVATQEAIMKSHEVLRRAARRLEGEALRQPPASGDYVGYIAAGVSIARLKDVGSGNNSNVLNVSFAGPAGEDCAAVVNAVIEGYRDSITGAVSELTEDNLNQVLRGVHDTEQKLREAETAYQSVHVRLRDAGHESPADLKARINVNEGKRSEMVLRKIDLESRLQLLRDGIAKGQDRATLVALYDLTSPAKKERAPAPEVGGPADALAKLQIEEEELLQTLGQDHPQVTAVRRRIQALRGQLREQAPTAPTGADPLDLYVRVLEKELETNAQQHRQLDKLLKDDRDTARKIDELLVDESLMRDRCDRLRKQLDHYTERKQQIDLTRDAPLFDARVITPAGPGAKVGPVIYQFLVLGAFAGLLLGGGLAYLADVTDRSFRSVEEVRQRLGLSVVGQIPALPPHEAGGPLRSRLDPVLVTHYQPTSREAEAFRGLRTTLYFSTGGKGHQVLQVTSSSVGEGKSIVSANLAISMAQSGKKVILIDADFRRPRVHQIFALPDPERGLASVIAGEATLRSVVRDGPVAGLSLLPCGPRPANPAELLTSAVFQEVLEMIKHDYDFVLIDTPPLLAVSDPAVVAPRVDGVVMVVRPGRNARPLAERARNVLAALGANVLGVVVNDADSEGGVGYGYAYAYGEDAAEPQSVSRVEVAATR